MVGLPPPGCPLVFNRHENVMKISSTKGQLRVSNDFCQYKFRLKMTLVQLTTVTV